MSPRARVFAITAAAAVLVVGATTGITLWQTRDETTTKPRSAAGKPQPGIPPLLFDFGVRNDQESADLARGARLLKKGERALALQAFERYDSVQAKLGEAFARWPDGSLDAVRDLAGQNPDDPVAQLHLGIAQYWSGRNADAVKTFEEVDRRFPDSPSAVDAENILYSNRFVPNLPLMIAPIALPEAPTLRAQLEAARGDPLVYGFMLWRLDRRLSARHQLDLAAHRAPNDPLVLTLDAVAHFAKPDPTPAFARLGPLSGRFPRAAVVHLHLGLLLLWTKELEKARRQFRATVDAEPNSAYARQAKRLLSALPKDGTK
jgi:tetratricopeptide (TPR) repeat protein